MIAAASASWRQVDAHFGQVAFDDFERLTLGLAAFFGDFDDMNASGKFQLQRLTQGRTLHFYSTVVNGNISRGLIDKNPQVAFGRRS